MARTSIDDFASAAKQLDNIGNIGNIGNINSLKNALNFLGTLGPGSANRSKLIEALGRSFKELDSDDLVSVLTKLDEVGLASKILSDIPIGDATAILKKINLNDSAKILKEMPDQKVADILKKYDNVEAGKVLGKMPDEKATAVANAMGNKWDSATKTMIVGTAIVGTGFYLDRKLKDAEEKIKECVDACLPEAWDEYKEGNLEKSKLTFSEVASTRKQPICKESITDCGEYCDSKCKEEHKYKPPLSRVPEAAGKGAGDIITDFFKKINPFNKDGIFGNTGWMSVVSSAILIFAMILLFTLKN